jgi:glycosyltransferase involved in cell wall biosynthesis
MEIGPMGKRIQSLGVPVHALGMAKGIPNPIYMLRLARRLREERPHLVQTWLYHADLLGGLAAKLAGGIPVVWNLRHSNLDRREKRRLWWTVRTCARASHHLPQQIICCSEASRREHVAVGYAAEKMIVIPNGSDVASFKPDPEARCSVREELNIPNEAPLIGLMARFHPQKDHRTFIEAAARLHRHRPDAHYLLCGEEMTESNRLLMNWIKGTGAPHCFHLLGLRMDVPRLTASLDIATSASAFGEGFPNVIIEAMACEVVCVVTDVGDSATIVADTGYVVSIRNPEALYQAWTQVLGTTPEVRRKLGRAARNRVKEHFDLPDIVTRYEQVFERFSSLAETQSALSRSSNRGSISPSA